MEQIGDSQDVYMMGTWNFSVGDSVDKGDVLCTVEVGKASVDIESPSSGRLRKIHIEEDQEFHAGALLCELEV
jgi:pyruvate/2-oxoglutarate dehydrogenase complex dihydrolipoamide acyltransferase (E2) component